MLERVPSLVEPLQFQLITGGLSNLTYTVSDASGQRWVLRRPPLGLVLGKPNHKAGKNTPDFEDLVAFLVQPGHGIMIHEGTWHDFPMAIDRPVTVFTMNSEEVVDALAAQKTPSEMNNGDVFKINVAERTGVQVHVNWA